MPEPLPRVGHIDFLNVLPLAYGYAHGGADDLVQMPRPFRVGRMHGRERDDLALRALPGLAGEDSDRAAQDDLELAGLRGDRTHHRLVDAGRVEAVEMVFERAVPRRREPPFEHTAHSVHRPPGDGRREVMRMDVDDHGQSIQ